MIKLIRSPMNVDLVKMKKTLPRRSGTTKTLTGALSGTKTKPPFTSRRTLSNK